MNEPKTELPGYWHFLWMFWMQPITLHHRLKACGVEQPNLPLWKWWHERQRLGMVFSVYLRRLRFHYFFILLVALFFLIVLKWLDLVIDWSWVWGSVIIGVVVGVIISVVFGVMVGVIIAVVFGVVIGVAFGVNIGESMGLELNVPKYMMFANLGEMPGIGSNVTVQSRLNEVAVIIFGVALGMTFDVVFGVAQGVLIGDDRKFVHVETLLWSIVLSVGLMVSSANNDAFLGMLCVGIIAGKFRVHFYFFECFWHIIISLMPVRGEFVLARSSVLFHELSYFPLPFLVNKIINVAGRDPMLVMRVLNACRIAPGQRVQGRWALAELQAHEIEHLVIQLKFSALAALQGQWLPGTDTDQPLLRNVAEIAKFLLAAGGAHSPHITLEHLQQASVRLDGLENSAHASREPISRFMAPVVVRFREVIASSRQSAEQAASTVLPNPFVTGNPLTQDLSYGRAVFRGREHQVREVERLLAGSQSSASIALIGPRRCGKSSMINMLRVLLPDTQVVVFDLQGNSASSTAVFYAHLADQAVRQAFQDRQLRLPALPKREAIDALRDWLEQLETCSGVDHILICIDEFERLESLFSGSRQELLQFMGLLRATIQHKRRVRLLVAGAAPFEELGSVWNDHFIGLREIGIGHLDREAALGLLMQPFPEFPADAIPAEVAEAIYARTGGQPFLTQLFGSLLIDHLNDEERRQALLTDVDVIEPQALEKAGYYFRDVLHDAIPDELRPLLQARAHGETVPFSRSQQRWLKRRLILDADGNWYVPVHARWLREYLDD